jgi:hypothetical protein
MNVTSPNRMLTPWGLMQAAEAAAEEVGVRLYNLRESGKGIAFTLKTGEPNEQRPDWRGKLKWQARYQRLSQGTRQSTDKKHPGIEFNPVVPGAVCWHGHRDFLMALYRRVPDAKVRTAFITYQNAEHFEANYRDTWNGAPDKAGRGFAAGYVPYRDACTCAEGGV